MAQKKRLSPNQLAQVKRDFAGLKGIPGYAPQRAEFKVDQIQPIEDELDDLLEDEAQMIAQLDNLRDRVAGKGGELIQKMNGVAQQIVAQYGDDSPEYQAVGRKRKSERATGRPKAKDNKPNG